MGPLNTEEKKVIPLKVYSFFRLYILYFSEALGSGSKLLTVVKWIGKKKSVRRNTTEF